MADSGREKYDAARAAALRRGRPPADPQTVPRRGDPRAAVRELMWPCGTCGHTCAEHHQTEGGNRTYCSIATGAGPCPCEKYVPAAEPEGVPDREVSLAYRGDPHGELLVADLLMAIDAAAATGTVTWVTAPGRGRIAAIVPID